MKRNKKKFDPVENLNKVLLIACPIIVAVMMTVFFINIHHYNTTMRVGKLDSAHFDGKNFNFGDVSVNVDVRGGESASWNKDPILDEEGNELHGQMVGTIYEALIYNNSDNVVADWTLKIPINEPMWINNNWNSKIEIHQDVNGNEKVLAIDLSDYYEYDINLDYYTDHTGPMIPLYEGDYFIYLPEEIAEEKPINPSKTGAVGEACARFGYIVYIANQGVDYVTDFSGGEIEYHMYANPLSKPLFWALVLVLLLWIIDVLVTVVVQLKMKRVLEQQKQQKEHDAMLIEQTMQLIINMIENKDVNTKGHSIRVAQISKMLATKMGFSQEEITNVYYIGLLHDCGKVNIPDSILKNPGKLTDEEYEVMKKHTQYGSEILKDFSSIVGIDIGAKYHHERYDGKGYPNGLEGEDIPVIARIIGVADAFDAMNSKRCYRDKLPKDYIMSELENNKNKQFDKEIVEKLIELIDEGQIEI